MGTPIALDNGWELFIYRQEKEAPFLLRKGDRLIKILRIYSISNGLVSGLTNQGERFNLSLF